MICLELKSASDITKIIEVIKYIDATAHQSKLSVKALVGRVDHISDKSQSVGIAVAHNFVILLGQFHTLLVGLKCGQTG